jgi:hypothetical protein
MPSYSVMPVAEASVEEVSDAQEAASAVEAASGAEAALAVASEAAALAAEEPVEAGNTLIIANP